MTKILFHSNQLGERGTEVAMFDYAYYSKYNLGIDCHVAYNVAKPKDTLSKFSDHFKILPYYNFDEVNKYISNNKIDWLYAIKGGKKDDVIAKDAKTFVHTVFQRHEPHGDKYVFISEWLAKKMGYNKELDYLPFIVTLPNVNYNYRIELDIPSTAMVLGRHGGNTEFNIPFVHQEIIEAIHNNPNLYFVFLNTDIFYIHERIKYLPKTTDRFLIRKFINTCDFMIHARQNGESFGLAIAEFLYSNVPVITMYGGMDHAHIDMCKRAGIFYANATQLKLILNNLPDIKQHISKNFYLPDLVHQFTPSLVIDKFERILND